MKIATRLIAIGLIMAGLLLLGLFMGHPLAFVLGGTAVLGAFIAGKPMVLGIVINRIFGDVLDNEKALTCVVHIGDEAIRAAAAAGIRLEPMQGHDINILAFKTAEEMNFRREIYKLIFGPHRQLRASMLQDLDRGVRTEIDAINGVICETGRRHGVATPVNDEVVAVVHDAEAGRVRPSASLLERFRLPVLPS